MPLLEGWGPWSAVWPITDPLLEPTVTPLMVTSVGPDISRGPLATDLRWPPGPGSVWASGLVARLRPRRVLGGGMGRGAEISGLTLTLADEEK